jgi:hypothetical protein
MGASWGDKKTDYFHCEFCLRAFSTKWGLRRHKKKDHNK